MLFKIAFFHTAIPFREYSTLIVLLTVRKKASLEIKQKLECHRK